MFIILVSVLVIFLHNVGGYALTPVEFIERANFTCETHYITTEDGYILTYYRIPNPNKPAVILIHGIVSSSADFVDVGRNRSLAFVLADAGYDIWIGNSRGNDFSRNHTTIKIDKNPEKFFNFSFHEMGVYDIPAAIDHILGINHQESLHYIGHSQGGTSFLVFASLRPEYAKKVKLASLLAPGVIFEHISSILQTVSKTAVQIISDAKNLNMYDFPFLKEVRMLMQKYCKARDFQYFCRSFFALVGGGSDDAQLDYEDMQTISMNFPNGFSLKQAEHYMQLIHTGGFRYFNYGPEQNQIIYGTRKHPKYKLSKIKIPIALYVAKNDGITGYENVPKILKLIPRSILVKYFESPYAKFNHMDFLWSKDGPKLFGQEMIRFMKAMDTNNGSLVN